MPLNKGDFHTFNRVFNISYIGIFEKCCLLIVKKYFSGDFLRQKTKLFPAKSAK